MERFLFNEAEFEEMYSCAHFSPQRWQTVGKPNLYVGVAYIIIGVVYDLLYLPFIVVMFRREFLKYSAYKIMLYLGIVDFVCIICNSIICGYLSVVGAVFCSYPRFIYVLGCVSTSLWTAACATCMLLGLNRSCEILFPKLCWKLFKNNRTYLWLALPTIYWFYFCFFTNPLLFSSIYYAMFFDPYVGITGLESTSLSADQDHEHWPHTVNNIVVVVVLIFTYFSLCAIVVLKSQLKQETNLNAIQKQTFIQVTIIVLFNGSAAAIYVYMQFFYTPSWLVILGQISWQFSHGVAVFVYLFLNPNLRNAVFELFGASKNNQIVVVNRPEKYAQ